MRLFIAIDFNELREELSKAQSRIDSSLAKLNPVSAFHLTMQFLGEVDDSKVELIKAKLKEIKFKPFSLALDKVGVFPSESYVRVIWAGVKPHDEVKELQKNVEEALKEFNFKKDFDFHPHITLARVRFVSDKAKFAKNINEIKLENKELDINDFRLVKSTLMRNGPEYEDVEIFSS